MPSHQCHRCGPSPWRPYVWELPGDQHLPHMCEVAAVPSGMQRVLSAQFEDPTACHSFVVGAFAHAPNAAASAWPLGLEEFVGMCMCSEE